MCCKTATAVKSTLLCTLHNVRDMLEKLSEFSQVQIVMSTTLQYSFESTVSPLLR